MDLVSAAALLAKLSIGIANAIKAGQTEVSESDLDDAMAALAASDSALSDAIARARAREAE